MPLQCTAAEVEFRDVFPNVTALLLQRWFWQLPRPLRRAAAQAPFAVNEVAPGVFVHQGRYEIFTPRNSGDTSNAGFIIGRDGVAVIDTGGSPRVGAQLLAADPRAHEAADQVRDQHAHASRPRVRQRGVSRREARPSSAMRKLPRALAARAERYLAINKELLGAAFDGTRIVPPTELVKDRLEVDLGDRKLLIEAHTTAHTDNDVTVLDEKTGTHVPRRSAVRQARAGARRLDPRLARPHRQARGAQGRRSSPCRGTDRRRMPWPAALAAEQRYLNTIADDVRAMIKQGKTLAEAGADRRTVRKRCVATVQRVSCAKRFSGVRRTGMGVAQAELRSRRKKNANDDKQPRRKILTSSLAAALALSGLVARRPSPPTTPGRTSAATCSTTATSSRTRTVTLEAPYRAEDAAIVPLTMRIPASVRRGEEPDAGHRQEPGAGRRHVHLRRRPPATASACCRRACASTCIRTSAPSSKPPTASCTWRRSSSKPPAAARRRLRRTPTRRSPTSARCRCAPSTTPRCKNRTPPTREAQVMIRHPNYTGMQMDQLTREYTPAKFVQEMDVKRGGELIFKHGRRHLDLGEPATSASPSRPAPTTSSR